MPKHLFNPLLYKCIPNFFFTINSDILQKHLSIFFHLIDNLELSTDLVGEAHGLDFYFGSVTRLLQMLGASFSSEELCDGKLFDFLTLVLDVLKNWSLD